jgi:hypothetical protein
MRLDNHGKITPEGWLLIALCAIIAGAVLAWAAITLIVELWMYLVTL